MLFGRQTFFPAVSSFSRADHIGSDLVQSLFVFKAMVVVVIDKLPRETQSTSNGVRSIKYFIVVDGLLKPVQFTLWDELTLTKGVEIFDELTEKKYPIVSLEDIKATDFK
ncbi:unnamed protein product, partial [Cuscuta epithymum]